jgi:bifunctional UDP-N-acetylglucosamine pyrophosphorylase/glucosamine-1-phosphate N-acetyltransferase
MKNFTAVVLAAGKGKRMKSSLPKVLHAICGKPLIFYVLKELFSLKKHIKQIIVVVGYQGGEVEKQVKKYFTNVSFVYQDELLGTANAVASVKNKVQHENTLVLCADVPLITRKTLLSFISSFLKKKVDAALITAHMDNENELGRIIRDNKGNISAIREKIELGKNNTNTEINSGIYAFKSTRLFNNLRKIKKNKKKGEYFLTDIIEILYTKAIKIGDYLLRDNEEILGINNQNDLYFAEQILRQKIIEKFIERGVRIIDPRNTYFDEGVKIGRNTIIYPFTFIEKDVIIGRNCVLGPFIRLREGTIIKNNTHLGNFIEVNRSKVGCGVRMKHFGYLGDTTVEDNANIGAGTVVANFDGKKKHKTHVGKGAFIGSDTVLVAPVKVGKGAASGAGSVVTRDVEPYTVVVGVPARTLKGKRKKR